MGRTVTPGVRAARRQRTADPVRSLAADAVRAALAVDDPALVERILAVSNILRLEAGDVLFHEGDPADAVFIVSVGRIALTAAPGRVFEEVERGGIVGSSAFLEAGIRQAGASAARDSVLVRLPREALEDLALEHPHAVLALTRRLFASIAPPLGRRVSRHNAVAVIGATASVDVAGFASSLADELRRYGPTALVEARHATEAAHGAQLERPEAAAVVSRWLYDQETAHAAMVYVSGGDPAWARLAVRQSDRVLIVADASDDPAHTVAGRFVADHAQRNTILVLLHRGAIAPGVTARWLEAVNAAGHVHVTDAADTARLARVVSGRATTVVFGGGGARAFAHAGVVRALRACGVPIDAVAGTSAGAIVAAYVAAGREDEIIELLGEGFTHLRDVTLPVTALLKGRRTTTVLRRQFGEARIEDLAIPFFCTSTDITDHRIAYHDRGDVVRALRASTAIAGVYPPVPIDGHLHIDGGVMNNVPADEMRRRYPDASVVAIDVSPVSADGVESDYGLWLSGWTSLRRRLGRRRTVVPGLADVLVRATVVASTFERMRLRRESVADLYLALDVDGMGGLKAEGATAAARTGYEYALPRIEEWLSSR